MHCFSLLKKLEVSWHRTQLLQVLDLNEEEQPVSI